jgi:menaquinone-dependent protoporphyrinogen oxidase
MTDRKNPNRRQFLKVAGGAVLATAAVGGGLIAAGTRQPAVELPETTYTGENSMSKNILVAYASKCGSTAGVAEAIGKTLQQQGASVDVRLAKNVTDVSPYQAVIVGSAIRMGGWLGDAKKLVQTHQQALKGIPTAYFSVCMTLEKDTPENRQKALAYMEPIRELVEPTSVAAFAGAMVYDKLSFIDRLIITRMIKTPEGDFRNWDAIQTWTEEFQTVME